MSEEILTGTIAFFDDSRGFGFVMPDRGGRDVYVGKRHVRSELLKGDRVEFTMGEYNGRPEAWDVTKVI